MEGDMKADILTNVMDKNISNTELYELYEYGGKFLSSWNAKYTIDRKQEQIK